MTAIEILRAASRSVPNEDYVHFCAAVDAVDALVEAANKANRAYWLARNSAAGLTNYCPESANSRRCERELDEAERIYRESGFDAALANVGGAA
jgi:hypothetical protein